MSFIEGFLALPQDLEDAYKQAKDDGAAGVSPDKIIQDLSDNVGDAIHDYMKTAMVGTVVTVEPGQTAAGPAGKGNYTAPGLGAGVGTVRFEDNSVTTLKNEIKALLKKQLADGSVTGCDPLDIIKKKAERTTEAIHKFALTAVVETDVLLAGGVPVVGYMTPVPAPLPAASLPTPPGIATGLGDPAQVDGTGLA